jgi:hypothetical protein
MHGEPMVVYSSASPGSEDYYCNQFEQNNKLFIKQRRVIWDKYMNRLLQVINAWLYSIIWS